MANLIQEIEAQIAGARATVIKQNVGIIREARRRRRPRRRPGRRDAERDARSRSRRDRHRVEPRGDRRRRDHHRRRHEARGGRGSPRDRQAASGASRQGAAGSSRQHARRAARRQGPDRQRRLLSRREGRAGHHAAAADQPARADRHHGHRRHDPDRPRTARADHRRSLDGQDDHLRRHDHQPGPPEQRGGSGGRQGLPSALLHLRRHRPEAIDDRTAHLSAGRKRRDALHDRRRGSGGRIGDEPVSGTVCRRRDRRMVHGQRHGRADRLRRPVQACRGLPPGRARPEAAVGPRGVSRRRLLPPQPAARTRRPRRARSTATDR